MIVDSGLATSPMIHGSRFHSDSMRHPTPLVFIDGNMMESSLSCSRSRSTSSLQPRCLRGRCATALCASLLICLNLRHVQIPTLSIRVFSTNILILYLCVDDNLFPILVVRSRSPHALLAPLDVDVDLGLGLGSHHEGSGWICHELLFYWSRFFACLVHFIHIIKTLNILNLSPYDTFSFLLPSTTLYYPLLLTTID